MTSRTWQLVGSIVTALALSGCSLFGIHSAREAEFKTLDKQSPYAVRMYQPVMIAEVTVTGKNYEQAANKGFKPLFDYIQGNNTRKRQISMTTPVTSQPQSQNIDMTVPVMADKSGQQRWQIRFVLPARYTPDNTPQPSNPAITIRQRPRTKVAVIRFSGSLTPRNARKHIDKLRQWVQKQQFTPAGNPVIAAYNPPWTLPFLRRNEIHIPLKD